MPSHDVNQSRRVPTPEPGPKVPEDRAEDSPALKWGASVCCAIIGAAVIWWSSPLGPAVSFDSFAYLHVAQNVLHGHGLALWTRGPRQRVAPQKTNVWGCQLPLEHHRSHRKIACRRDCQRRIGDSDSPAPRRSRRRTSYPPGFQLRTLRSASWLPYLPPSLASRFRLDTVFVIKHFHN